MHPNSRPSMPVLLLITTFLTLASAQQGVLASGNSQLPACAQQCTLLNQAAQACQGSTSATTAVWNCFCQSGYLKNLYNSPAGICDNVCTAAADNQNVMTWYKSNCGTDNGVSEHANGAAPSAAAPSGTATTTPASTSASAAPTASSSGKVAGGVTKSGTAADVPVDSNDGKPWIDTHYQWIIFVVVVLVGFAAITVLAVWYKRRYYRRQDQINGVFNSGVSEQTPQMSNTVDPSQRNRDSTRFA